MASSRTVQRSNHFAGSFLIMLLCLGLLTLTGFLLFRYLLSPKAPQSENFLFDNEAQTGTLQSQGQNPAEDSVELLEKGTFRYVMNSSPGFSQRTGRLTLLAENPQENQYYMQILLLDSQGKELYRSGFLMPGSFLDTVTPGEDTALPTLAVGSYPVTARFDAYAVDTLEFAGSLSCSVTLVVGE